MQDNNATVYDMKHFDKIRRKTVENLTSEIWYSCGMFNWSVYSDKKPLNELGIGSCETVGECTKEVRKLMNTKVK